MNSEIFQSLCNIIESQNSLLRRLLDLLAQHQAEDEYEAELELQDNEYAALIGDNGGR